MYLIKLAWDNLWYNRKRTISMLLLIALALSSTQLFKGYVEYSAQGMKIGYVYASGHFQIAKKGFWDELTSATMLDENDLTKIETVLAKHLKHIASVEPILDFNGIIGNEKTSAIFFGRAYEHSEANSNVKEGVPVFAGEDAVILGSGLAKRLGIYDLSGEPYVNIMSVLGSSGMSLGSFTVNGTTQVGVPQVDNGLVITSRQAALHLFGLSNAASTIQIRLERDNRLDEQIQNLKQKFKSENLEVEIRDWKELNPSYEQIVNYQLTQFYVLSLILSLFVFVALMQTLSTNFLERLPEFGTMDAIGMKKKTIARLLSWEVIFLALLGILAGIFFSFLFKYFFDVLQIKVIPPGRTVGYVVEFYLTLPDVFFSSLFIFMTCLLSTVFPVREVLKKQAIQLMGHV